MGHMINDSYTDKDGNNRVLQIKVIADQVEFCGYNKSDIEPKQTGKEVINIDDTDEFKIIG